MHKAFVLVLLALVCASCVPPKVDLEGKKCDAAGACVEGFACVAGVCVHAGAVGTPCQGTSGCDSTLICVNGTCASVPDGGCSLGQTRACGSAVGTCTQGVQVCVADGGWGACDGGVQPAAESCDGRDEDCDGVADNAGEDGGFTCALDADGGPCTTACGSTGTRICKNDCSGFACVAPLEVCNGQDDDCLGGADDTFVCVQGSRDGGSCQACNGPGVKTCADDCSGYVCRGPAESCNGIDDDCDGAADNGFACAQGSDGGPCNTSCGSTGTNVCAGDCSGFTCTAPAESCNGVDDDCDGVPDNGFACAQGSPQGTCTLGCGATGYQPCKSDCSGPDTGTCLAPAERCNGLDDNCQDGIDEGLTQLAYDLPQVGATPEPVVAAGPDGGVLVYVDSSSGTGKLYVQRLDATYAPSNNAFLAHPSSAAQSSPQAALTRSGALIGWLESGGIQIELIGSQSQGAPITAVPTSGQVTAWSMAAQPDSDTVWLAWVDASGALMHEKIVGGQVGASDLLGNTGRSLPAVAVAPDGRVAILSRATTGASVHLDTIFPDAGLDQSGTHSGPFNSMGSVAWTSAGCLAAIPSTTTGISIFLVNGTTFTPGATFSNATAAHLVGSPDGAALAFSLGRALADGGSSTQLAVARLDATGNEPLGAQVSPATPLPGAQPFVTYNGTGYLAAWSGGGTDVYQQLICP